MNTTRRLPQISARRALFSVLAWLAVWTVADASQPEENPADFLSFEQRLDGRCYNLSEGGKLMLMYNHHPSLSIEYRLIRFFANKRQQGRVTGTAAHGDTPVKLGCTEVDGRPQHWEIERTKFVTD